MEWPTFLDPEQMARDGELLIRITVATVLSIPLGWDRERKDRPAGLRTHMLVAAASATFMALGDTVIESFRDESGMVQMDPLRTLEAVVTGLGFLAAGTIFRAEGGVKGLTTAASIWVTAAVALCVGSGRYVLGTGVMVIALLVLVVLRKVIHDEDSTQGPGVPKGTFDDGDAAPKDAR